MDLEKLLEQIKAISQILKNPSLQTSSSHIEGVEELIKEFDLLVEKTPPSQQQNCLRSQVILSPPQDRVLSRLEQQTLPAIVRRLVAFRRGQS